MIQVLKNFIYLETGGLSLSGKVFYSLIIVLIARLVLSALTQIINRTLNKKVITIAQAGKVDTVRSLLISVVRVLIIFISSMMILDLFGVNTTSVLATAGVGGVALAFGAQSLVKDVIAGIFILMEDQYAVGDMVTVAGVTGVVVSVGFRVTKLQDYQGNIHYIPNGAIGQVQNASQGPQRTEIQIALAYDVTEDSGREMAEYIKERLLSQGQVFHEEPNYRGIVDLQPRFYMIAITARVDPADRFAVQFKMRSLAMDFMVEKGLKSQSPMIIEEVDHAQV